MAAVCISSVLPSLTCRQSIQSGEYLGRDKTYRSRTSVGVNLYYSFQTKESFKLVLMKSINEIQNYVELFGVWNVLLKTQPLFC